MSRRGLAIATACAGGFLAFLDTTIVNTAFPGIAASFPDASAADLAWVLDAYFIVIAALLVPAGGIADRIGRKRVFLAGLALFTGASALCAAAPGLEVLIAARALQGAGAAVIMAVSLALILPLYPVAQRASAVALWGASAALAAASGPPLGGALVELDWRWVFVVNLPLGVAIFLAGRAAFVEQRDERMAGLPDLLGAALVMGGLGLLSLAILEGGTWGWTSLRVLAAFAASAFLLAATAHRCLTHPRPVIDPALLRIGTFARANVGLLLLGMAFFSTILANVLFLVGVWGYSVLTAGLAVVPGAIATAAVAVPAGKIADRYGQSAVIVPGCLLYVAGMAIVRSAGIEPAFLTTWLPAMLLNGAGLGLAFPAFAAAALRDVPAEHFGSASAVTSATRQLGGVLGTAVLFAVGAPITLAAAEDAYLVSTLWALGAGVVAATLHGRVFTLGLGAVIVTGVLVLAGPPRRRRTRPTQGRSARRFRNRTDGRGRELRQRPGARHADHQPVRRFRVRQLQPRGRAPAVPQDGGAGRGPLGHDGGEHRRGPVSRWRRRTTTATCRSATRPAGSRARRPASASTPGSSNPPGRRSRCRSSATARTAPSPRPAPSRPSPPPRSPRP